LDLMSVGCLLHLYLVLFLSFFYAPPPTETYTLSLHDALPIYARRRISRAVDRAAGGCLSRGARAAVRGDERGYHRGERAGPRARDRKSTRLNSSHVKISYAVFCLKKKKKDK